MQDHYTVELRKGEVGNMAVLRSHEVKSVEDATNLIDGFYTSALQRDGVTWQREEIDPNGTLYGLTDDGTVYMISVVPPLSESLLV